MNAAGNVLSQHRLFVVLLLLSISFSLKAATPSIQSIKWVSGAAQLTIISDIGVADCIQSTTNTGAGAWTALTNFVVNQSPYTFVDSMSGGGSMRFYRILQSATNAAPPGMVLIPAGMFQMGDTFNEGFAWEVPVHMVYVSAFYMDKFEVTKSLWDQVYNWGLTNGYSFDNPGAGKAPNHPVQYIDWYDMVKWCNARSQMERRPAAYYTDAGLTQVYKTGQVAPYVNWYAGYRLPTEAEWEKGARGGATGHRFPWSDTDTITHSQANYYSDSRYSYDVSPTRGYNPVFVDGVLPYTSPVGSFAPNAYGLYDMAGNVWEWVWDYSGNYTSDTLTDPRGPATGDARVGRGGNWNFYAEHCRDAYRYGNPPTDAATNIGFRCALPGPN
jgi:formylglycine-generating enzyme